MMALKNTQGPVLVKNHFGVKYMVCKYFHIKQVSIPTSNFILVKNLSNVKFVETTLREKITSNIIRKVTLMRDLFNAKYAEKDSNCILTLNFISGFILMKNHLSVNCVEKDL